MSLGQGYFFMWGFSNGQGRLAGTGSRPHTRQAFQLSDREGLARQALERAYQRAESNP
jgi:hypothetical protein